MEFAASSTAYPRRRRLRIKLQKALRTRPRRRPRPRIRPRGVMECWSVGVLRQVRIAPATG
jgi:hypothetical protein